MRRMRHIKAREFQGCEFACNSSAGLYDATSGGSEVAADGAVARWEDSSGNNRHVTQSNTGYQPLRKTSVWKGYDTVRFNPSNPNDRDHLLGGSFLNGKTLTSFSVSRRAVDTPVSAVMSCGRGGGDTRVFAVVLRNQYASSANDCRVDPSSSAISVNDQSASMALGSSPMSAPAAIVTVASQTVSVVNSTDLIVGGHRDADGSITNHSFVLDGDLFEIGIFGSAYNTMVAKRMSHFLQRKYRIASQ